MTLGKNGKLAVKWAGYIGILLLALGIQSQQSLFYIGRIGPVLIVSAAVALSFFESELTSAFFGLGAGLLWDIVSGKIFGFYGIVLMICCAAVALLSMHIIKVSLPNATVFCVGVLFGCLCWDFLFYHLIWGYEGVWLIFKDRLLITLYSAVFAPPIYLAMRKFASIPGNALRA